MNFTPDCRFSIWSSANTNCLVSADLKGDKSSATLYWKSAPIVTFEFEGASRYRVVWNALQGETESGRLDMTADDPAAKLVDDNWQNIQDVLVSLYLP